MSKENSETTEEHGHPFWPVHVLDQGIQFYIWIGLVLTVAIMAPIALHEVADPMTTPPGIKPEWYFLPIYQALKYVPELLGILGMGLLAVTTIFWPFIDGAIEKRWPGKRAHRRIVMGAIALMAFLGVLGHISDRTYHLGGKEIEFDTRAMPRTVEPGADADAEGVAH